MNWTMYLDDLRTPTEKYDVICRSYADVVRELNTRRSFPSFISFDHDLGKQPIDENDPESDTLEFTGYDVAKLLVDIDMDDKRSWLFFSQEFSFKVHSANPIGKENIEHLLNNYLAFKRKSHE